MTPMIEMSFNWFKDYDFKRPGQVNYALNEHELHLVSATGTLTKVEIIFALSYWDFFLTPSVHHPGTMRALLW